MRYMTQAPPQKHPQQKKHPNKKLPIFPPHKNTFMITGELRNDIDKIWNYFWSGGVTNPVTVIEQLTYLMFLQELDNRQNAQDQLAALFGEGYEKKVFFEEDQESLRWSNLKEMNPEERFAKMRDEVFPFMREELSQGKSKENVSIFARYMQNASFMIPSAKLLDQVVLALSSVNYKDSDTKGDLYEYLLSKLSSAGKNGQFRTPRHIIRLMVDMMQPNVQDTICDPSAGTAGFLVEAADYVRKNHQDALVKSENQAHFRSKMFSALEFDPTMVRVGAMNLFVHGIEQPLLRDINALSPRNADLEESCSLILANPPFKGTVDKDDLDEELTKVVNTKKSELLFLAQILRLLKNGGRAAVIIPDGVLFGSSKAHKEIRKQLVEKQELQAVISMPSGVFKPYAGVSTAILIFTKTNAGGTDKVWFYDMQADGFSLDDKRQFLGKEGQAQSHEENNLPDILQRWAKLEEEDNRSRTDQSFMVPLAELQENDYDLSINRYKEIQYEAVAYDPPQEIIQKIQQDLQSSLKELSDLQQLLD
ncbi:type I restriction-modification system subunit M [Saprospira grandis]|nr:class I SAM-dependent DNA methyltransferase [Saprospira grandis]WBM74027.1 type I restriction-modification system subunit M [Saprospira grandis]